jgi:hypothetical protein
VTLGYPGASRLRTAGRFAVFAAVDLAASLALSSLLFALIYASVLRF